MKNYTKLNNLINKARKAKSRKSKLSLNDGSFLVCCFEFSDSEIPSFIHVVFDRQTEIYSNDNVLDLIGSI